MFSIRFVAVQLLAAFMCCMMIGLVVGSLFIATGIQTYDNPSDPANAVSLIIGILITTGLLLLVLKFYKGNALLKGLEALMMFASANLFISLFFDDLVTLALSLGLLAVRFVYEPIRPYLLMFAAVVVGGFLGSQIGLVPVLLFAVLISGYDFIAVFLTKHMIVLAERMSEKKTSLTVNFSHKKQQVMLGSGDFVVPIVLSVSLLNSVGLFVAVAAAFGAAAGLGSLLYIMERKKGYYPGLPPIVFGSLLFTVLAMGAKAVLHF
ncbi:hypothetical protein HY994_01150 [Candidatus Micrarchaeota archaeon]|nr:hypothetical protein [Candidatus Micrarchaeota archaeon]